MRQSAGGFPSGVGILAIVPVVDAALVIGRADHALYGAKSRGRDHARAAA